MWNRFKKNAFEIFLGIGYYKQVKRKNPGFRMTFEDRIIIEQVNKYKRFRAKLPFGSSDDLVGLLQKTHYDDISWAVMIDDDESLINASPVPYTARGSWSMECLIFVDVLKWKKLGDLQIMDMEFILEVDYCKKFSGFYVKTGDPTAGCIKTRSGFVYTDGDEFFFDKTPEKAKQKAKILQQNWVQDLIKEICNNEVPRIT